MKRGSPTSDEGVPVVTTAGQKVLLVGFGLGLFCLGLALLEGALALLGAGDRHLYEDPFVGFAPGRDLFAEKRLEDGRTVWATNPGKLSFFDYQEFAHRKPPGSYRIFALGGSTTAGRPYDSRVAFPRWMELYLEAMDPSREYEVVNAGAISYASYRIVLLMRELVRYEPDLFVIYTGHNEFLEERTYADIIHEHPALKRLRLRLGGLRLYTLTRQALRSLRDDEPAARTLESEVATRLDSWAGLDLYRRDDELKRSILEHFGYNLRQMVAIARDHGAGVVFVEPVSNLKDFSPFKSQHAASLSPSDAEAVAALLAAGRQHLGAGRAAEATAAFEEALALDPEYAESHFRLGRSLLQEGDTTGARAAFLRAKELDVAPLRALEPLVDLVASVAAENGLPLVDLPAVLEAACEELYGHSILGNEFLLDHVHPNPHVHGRIAELVIEGLVRDGVVRPAPDWSEEKKRAVTARMEASIDREYRALRDHNLAKVLTWAGKLEEAEEPLARAAEVLTDDPEVWLNQGILYEKTGRWEEAVRALRRAIRLDPGSPEAHFNLGTNLGYLGRPREGIAALREAIRLRPDDPLAHLNLGVLYRDVNELEQAVAAFERAGELAPDASEVPRNLGIVYRRQGRAEEAVAAFERALELDPEDVRARTELGIVHAREGRLDVATRELQRALELDPGHAAAHYNLAVVHSRQGRPQAAIAAYEKTLEFAPDNAEARNNLGILYARQGRLEDAESALRRAVEADPGYADARFNLGLVLHDAGRLGEALAAIERAIELDPENARMRSAIAGIYRALGDEERARFHQRRAGS